MNTSLAEVESVVLSNSLHDFVREAWKVLEPATPFQDGWHIKAICDHLEAMEKGDIKSLIVNQPPRTSKSRTVSVFFPAWVWTRDPRRTFLYVSYTHELSEHHSRETRQLILSPWYQERWPLALKEDKNTQMRFDNVHGGRRVATTISGVGTGLGGNYLIADDPNNAKEHESEAKRKQVVTYCRSSFHTRIDGDPREFRRIIVQQRTHQEDATGWALEEGGWELLCLPMRYEGQRSRTSLNFTDPRTKEGELLCPDWYDEAFVSRTEKEMRDLAPGQLQQRPTAAGGGIFKQVWWKRYRKLPEEIHEWVQSWDMAFKATKASSYVVGQLWARSGPNFYLVDQVRRHMEFTDTVQAVMQLCEAWPMTSAVYVEDKANGPAVIDYLRKTVPGLIPVNPEGDKPARARSIAPFVESGNVWVPEAQWFPSSSKNSDNADSVQDFMDEMALFPNAKHDDQVDAMSQALRQIAQHAHSSASALPEIQTARQGGVMPSLSTMDRSPMGGLRGMRGL